MTKVKTHVGETIDPQKEIKGNSRRGGDAPPEIQQKIVDIIIEEARKLKFNNRDISYYIAIAKRESGFNPDAANSSSTASGVAQLIDETAKTYGVTDTNRFDARANIGAGLQYFAVIKKKIIKDFGSAEGKYEALIYHCYHYGEFSVNRRETVKGNVVVKEALPFSALEGTPKYNDSQTVVDEAARIEKILNDNHALQIKLVDIMGKAMFGRKVIVLQKVAVAPPATKPTPAAAAPVPPPIAAPVSAATDTPTPSAPVKEAPRTEVCVNPPSEPPVAWEWKLVAKEMTTDEDGNLPIVESDSQEPILVLIPRIDYEAYNKAVAEFTICEDGNKHRIEPSGGEQGALPTIKEVPATPPLSTQHPKKPAKPVAQPVVPKPPASPIAALEQDKKDAALPKPSVGPGFSFADVVVALKKNLNWEHVYETSFSYIKQFYTRPKLPEKPLDDTIPAKAGEARVQVIGSSIKKQDVKTLNVKDKVTTAEKTAVKKVEAVGDATWMKFAIEEQGKSGLEKVKEKEGSHITDPEWKESHKARTEAESAIRATTKELNKEKKKSAKTKDDKKIEELQKKVKEQETARDTADDAMKVREKEFNNPDVIKYLQSTNVPRDMARNDSTAWCASFLNWCIEAGGYKGLSDGAARAENWRRWGEKLEEPQYGAITVTTRASNPVEYHVGFYTGIQDKNVADGTEDVEVKGKDGKAKTIKKKKYKIVKMVQLLSGNMSRKITEQAEWAVDEADNEKNHLVDYRWPTAKEKK